MDVHKDRVTGCVLLIDEEGELGKQTRYFSTMTHDLKEMSGWLASLGVEAIAREATGVMGSLSGTFGKRRRSSNCFW